MFDAAGERGDRRPGDASSLNYLALSLHLPLALRGGRPLAAPSWQYALWAFCDVEANYLVVAAFQYTSIVSVTLLDCFAIPSAIACSFFILRVRYGPRHVAACCVCVAGLATAVFSDVVVGRVGPSPRGPAWIGDVLVLCGASLYGLSNVMQERLLKGGCSRPEALGMLGAWGSAISFVQAVALERGALARSNWNVPAWKLSQYIRLASPYHDADLRNPVSF
ncbi:unnamed protein product [Prorocentrum cordatum]|uniref:Solute carrier family 40 protein n=1 Tax=Prorocentrum cordatum TaxID=2364126 RepID=A0ABN9UJC1_9DINO|nr:unnamed protein product [Polarella glacialis]